MRTAGPLHVAACSLGFVIASTFSLSCSNTPPAAEPPPVEVRVMPVVQRDAVVSIELVGDVRGSQQVDVRARVGGVITKKRFTDGSFVREGQVLFTIDPREFLASRADARARLAEAEATLAQANQEVERYRPLVEANATPKRTYDTAVTAAQLGRHFVMVVGNGDIAEQRAVTMGPRLKDQWVIERGVSTGEHVIVECLQKIRPGIRVQPTAATAAASSARQPTNVAR